MSGFIEKSFSGVVEPVKQQLVSTLQESATAGDERKSAAEQSAINAENKEVKKRYRKGMASNMFSMLDGGDAMSSSSISRRTLLGG